MRSCGRSWNENSGPERELFVTISIFPGWDADKVVDVVSKNGISHKLYLYVRP